MAAKVLPAQVDADFDRNSSLAFSYLLPRCTSAVSGEVYRVEKKEAILMALMITMCQQSCIKKWRDGGSWTSSKE